MDASSIITQVSKDDDQVNTYPYPLGKVSPKEIRESSPNSLLKKPRRRFLRTLFCCFSRNSNSKSTESSLNNQDNSFTPASPEAPRYLLDAIRKKDLHKKCMVIDLDETLVHSSFKPINNADFVVPVEIDGKVHQVYVLKRPYVDEFLKRMGELYECILFTASLAKVTNLNIDKAGALHKKKVLRLFHEGFEGRPQYADPVTDLLDRWGVFRARLFRDSCVFHRGNYVKDLNKLGRDLKKIIIVDNSPASYIFQPDNAVPVASWFDDMTDSELLDLIPFFEKLSKVDNIYSVLCNSNHPFHASNYANNAQSSSNMQVNNHTTVVAGS